MAMKDYAGCGWLLYQRTVKLTGDTWDKCVYAVAIRRTDISAIVAAEGGGSTVLKDIGVT